MNAPTQIQYALRHMFIHRRAHIDICSDTHSFALTQTCGTSSPPPSFHPKTLTCPLHLSIIQSVIPGVNHLSGWPAITACSQNEHQPSCCSPAWTPHPNHNAFGLPPTFLQPPSFYLSLSIHNTHIYGLKQIHHSEYSMNPLRPCLGSYPTIPGI